MSYEFFALEWESDIAILKVSRPKALNSLNRALLREWSALLDDSKLRACRALVITGAGEKAFIAGADISEMAGMSASEAVDFSKLGQRVSLALQRFPAPVIAAVNGYALGGGCEMAISCDFIVAADTAVFGLPEVGLGLIPGFGGTVRLAEFVGWSRAKELIYTGRKISAAEAVEMGIVLRISPRESLLGEAIKLAKEVSKNSPLAVKTAKENMLKIRDTLRLEDALAVEASSFSAIFGSFDQKEGTAAFVEKRAPQFRGE